MSNGEIVCASDASDRNCAEQTVAMNIHSWYFDQVGAGGPGGGPGAGVGALTSSFDIDPFPIVDPAGDMTSVIGLSGSFSYSGFSKVEVGVAGIDISSRTSKLFLDPHARLVKRRRSLVGVFEPESQPDEESIEECL
jgi:hypothetical protein